MNPKRLLADIRLNLVLWSRYRSQIIVSLLLPTIFLVILGAVYGATSGVQEIAVVDHADTPGSEDLVRALENTSLEVTRADDPPAPGETGTWMRGAGHGLALEIPPGYQGARNNSTTGSQASNVTLYMDPQGVDTLREAPDVVGGVVARQALGDGETVPFSVETPGDDDGSATSFSYRDFLLPGMVGLVVLSLGLLGTSGMASSYDNLGLFKKLSTTPLTKREWIASKMVLQITLVTLGVGVLAVLARVLYGTEATFGLMFFALVAAGTMAFAGLGLAIVGAIDDDQRANSVLNLLYLPMLFLSGTFLPVRALPPAFQAVAQFLPLTYLVRGFQLTLLFDSPHEAWDLLAFMVVLGGVSLVVGARLTDWSGEGS